MSTRLVGAARTIAVSDVKRSIEEAVLGQIRTLRATYSPAQTVKLLQTATRELLAESAARSQDVRLTRAVLEEWR